MDPQARAAIDDPARLAAVRATGLLDTGAEEPFDRLARLAATVLETPLAFVTIVDDRRSFWKSCIGVDADAPEDRQNTVEESFCQYVVGSGEPLIVDDARIDPRTSENPSIEAMGVATWAGFPVHSPDGQVLGTFCVVDFKPRRWSERDVEVLSTLSQAASGEVALRGAIEDERTARRRADTLARTLQEGLMPAVLPPVPGLDLAARFQSAGDGTSLLGDFYDAFQIGPGQWAVVIGDVCGSGVEAAKITALARYSLRATAMGSSAPSVMLAILNEAMLHHDPTGALFLTAALAVVRPTAHGAEIRLALGGHPAPLLRRGDGSVEAVGLPGTLLGHFHAVNLDDVTLHLTPDETLLFYTDGLSEAYDDQRRFLGEDGLRTLLGAADGASAESVAHTIMGGALDHTGGGAHDDMAVLALRPAP